jgi:hypothetical protein
MCGVNSVHIVELWCVLCSFVFFILLCCLRRVPQSRLGHYLHHNVKADNVSPTLFGVNHATDGQDTYMLLRIVKEIMSALVLLFAAYTRSHDVQVHCDKQATNLGRLCVTDESFIPTLLMAYNLTTSASWLGQITYTEWVGNAWHPTTLYPDFDARLIARMRKDGDDERYVFVHAT